MTRAQKPKSESFTCMKEGGEGREEGREGGERREKGREGREERRGGKREGEGG